MKVILYTLKNDIKLLISDWKSLLIILLMPILMILYFSYAVFPYMNKDVSIEPFSIGLVDNQNSIESRAICEQLKNIKLISHVYNDTENGCRKLISENKIAAAIIIPKDFTSSITSGKNKNIIVLGNPKMSNQSQIIKDLVVSSANIVSSGQAILYSYYHFMKETDISNSVLDDEFNNLSQMVILKSLDRKAVISDIKTYPQSNLTPSEYYTAALFAIFLMYSGMPILKMLVIERNLGITKRLSSTNVGSFTIIFSKLLLCIILSVIELLIIFIATSTIVKNYWGSSYLALFLLSCAGIFAVSCWLLLVSIISNNLKEAQIIGNLSILLMALLGGSIYPLSKMSSIIKYISLVTINRWIQEGFAKIFSGNRYITVFPQVIPLLIIGTVFILLSTVVHRFKKGC